MRTSAGECPLPVGMLHCEKEPGLPEPLAATRGWEIAAVAKGQKVRALVGREGMWERQIMRECATALDRRLWRSPLPRLGAGPPRAPPNAFLTGQYGRNRRSLRAGMVKWGHTSLPSCGCEFREVARQGLAASARRALGHRPTGQAEGASGDDREEPRAIASVRRSGRDGRAAPAPRRSSEARGARRRPGPSARGMVRRSWRSSICRCASATSRR